MKTIEKSIEVTQPVSVVYDQWTQFEDFPKFMTGVKQVLQLDDTTLHWKAEVGGKIEEWDAEIFEQVPDQRIAWRSISGAKNSGTVDFRPLDGNKTKVTVNLNYDPKGTVENIGGALGVVGARVSGDLERFKNFIENRGAPTGAWRGQIHGPEIEQARPERGGPLPE